MSMIKDKIDILDLFYLYYKYRHEDKCSGHELDSSAIDYDAFIQALNEFLYDTSISTRQHCFRCQKKVGLANFNKERYCSEQCWEKHQQVSI